MKVYSQNNIPSFEGITRMYAIADSHQEARRTGALLSEVLRQTFNKDNALFINAGDIFKGAYPRELERDCYIKAKEIKPDLEMAFTIGNNDIVNDKPDSLNFLIDTVKKFAQKGIHTVCANIFELSGKRPEWLKPYAIITRDGDRNFVTGFCINNMDPKKCGIDIRPPQEYIKEISEAIKKEKPDNVIMINHNFLNRIQQNVDDFKEAGIDVDLTIGGHDHRPISPDVERKIYYPTAYSETMYKMDLQNENNAKSLNDVKSLSYKNLELLPELETPIKELEDKTKFLEPLFPYKLNLTKDYINPCPMGTFLADNMKKTANADVGFFSTGFISHELAYKPNEYITSYLVKRAMPSDNPIWKAELTTDELKEIFVNALRDYIPEKGNHNFLQCSGNMKFEGKQDKQKNIFNLTQIYIDGEPLLNSKGEAINPNRKYKCVFDNYSAFGGNGFNVLNDAQKNIVSKDDGTPIKIYEVLKTGLEEADKIYKPGSEYPSFKVEILQ